MPDPQFKRIWAVPAQIRGAIWDVAGYTPSPEQMIAHLADVRQKLVSGGERGGKSKFTAMELLIWVAATLDGLFWLVGPDYEQARAEFQHLVDALAKLNWLAKRYAVSTPKVGGWRVVTRQGNVIETKTSHEIEKLASVAPSGICMCEAAQQEYGSYLRCRGRVAEKRGPIILSGTFEGSFGWYPELWQRWQGANEDGGHSYSLPTWSNLAIYPGGRQDPEILALEATYPADEFLERFGAIPCPPRTLVFREFRHLLHIRDDADYRESRGGVQLWVDPGYAAAYAVDCVQVQHGQVHHFDEIYLQGYTGEKIIPMVQAKPWYSKVNLIVMDVASKAHPATQSQSELWRDKTGRQIVMNSVGVDEGITRHHTFLEDPSTGKPRLFHHPRCKHTIGEYGKYRYQQDNERRSSTEIPIDRDNHSMKALAYGLVANFGKVEVARRLTSVTVAYGRG